MRDKINRWGICPNCQTSWKGNDVLEHLASLSCNAGKSHNEVKKLAANYGYTEDNKLNFSNLKSVETENNRNLLQCPKISCGHVFDRYTGLEYKSMYDAQKNIIYERIEVIPDLQKNIDIVEQQDFSPF